MIRKRQLELVDDTSPELTPSKGAIETIGLANFMQQHIARYFAAHDEGVLPPSGLYTRVLREVERPIIDQTLRACQWNQKKAALILGINRNTLRKKINELGIEIPPK
jgi:two-component system nitrogen regulation response regulator GlnG